ncbi:MAG TPA: DUF4157 domain-containing protein [Acidimicrobiales bacterium]|jgi:hypothetical protein
MSEVLRLQRAIGNRAVSRLAEASWTTGDPEPGPAPALIPEYEAEADRIADRAANQMDQVPSATPRRIWTADGHVSPVLAGLLRNDIPSTRDIHLDRSPTGRREADAMGARAFSQGPRIVLRDGGRNTWDRDSVHVATHEIAHAALHPVAKNGSNLVHAKLRGTSAALRGKGGGPSSNKGRQLLAKLGINKKTHWDRIVDGVSAYEVLEEKLTERGGTPEVLQRAKPNMQRLLGGVSKSIDDWQATNDKGDTHKADQWHDQYTKQKQNFAEEDTRTKAPRRQAIAILKPRVETERADVAAGRWDRTLGLSDAAVKGRGHSAEGGMNKVQELHYLTDGTAFSAYFKEDKGFDSGMAGHDADMGIHQADPNYSARSVAMYRLDQLLGANVTARAEFAVHNGSMGLALESAKGVRGADAKVGLSGSHASAVGADFSADDAVLQRCLNKLQILDAIAGQLDRHGGNYFIQHDAGKVVGVKGIDLDMAFGGDMKSPRVEDVSSGARNYKGIPDIFDADISRRVMAIKDKDIWDTLEGLLSGKEIVATLDRLHIIQNAMREAVFKDKMVEADNWGTETAASEPQNTKLDHFRETNQFKYQHHMRSRALMDVEKRAADTCKKEIEERLSPVKPPQTVYAMVLAATDEERGVPAFVSNALYAGKIIPSLEVPFTNAAIWAVLNQSSQMKAIEEETTNLSMEEINAITLRSSWASACAAAFPALEALFEGPEEEPGPSATGSHIGTSRGTVRKGGNWRTF